MICCESIIIIQNVVFILTKLYIITFQYNVNEASINIVLHCVIYSYVKSKNKKQNEFVNSITKRIHQHNKNCFCNDIYIFHLLFCCKSMITSEQNISHPIYNNQVFFYVSESHVLIILVLVGLWLGSGLG